MKKIFAIIATLALAASCSTSEDVNYSTSRVLKGYCSIESRTQFETPTQNQIPFSWSAGDYIWVGTVQSNPIAEACKSANFDFGANTPSVVGNYNVFYNMTGTDKTAKVLAEQTADGNLGNDGDFGYAVADEFDTFVLEHKVAYLWFDTTSEDITERLVSIKVTAEESFALAGERVFNFESKEWAEDVTNASNSITLKFGEGVVLSEANEGVFAAMVTYPAEVDGTELTVVYTFADGKTFTEVKTPSKDFAVGAARRIATNIAVEDLVAPAPQYQLRTLTFEDNDAQFAAYPLDYCSKEIRTWGDLVAESQMPGSTELLYGPECSYSGADYYWSDTDNTLLTHSFAEGGYGKAFSSGGVAVSNYIYTGPLGEADLSADLYADNSAYQHQLSVYSAKNPNNFAVGYCDSTVDGEYKNEIWFADSQPRVIESMNVCIPVVTYYCIKYGSSFNDPYGEDDYLKLVATGTKSDGTTSTLEFVLAEGADDSEWAQDWTKWDLSSLGAVTKIALHMEEAQSVTYDSVTYYYCSPLFFAIDDITVRFEE